MKRDPVSQKLDDILFSTKAVQRIARRSFWNDFWRGFGISSFATMIASLVGYIIITLWEIM